MGLRHVRRNAPVVMVVLAASLVATGCGGDDDRSEPARVADEVSPARVNYDFDRDSAGKPARAFVPLIGEWVIERDPSAPSPPNVYSQIGTQDKKPPETDAGKVLGKQYADFLDRIDEYELFPASIFSDASFRDFDASAYFKPISGEVDQAGGITFRVTSPKDYYVWRCNALESDCRLFIYKDGRRGGSVVDAKAPVKRGEWQRLRVVVIGDRMKGYLGERELMDFEDTTFRSGRVGLWTKDDSVTEFDDFKVKPLD